jgi:DNA-binding LacI/PurR family transcriptional regulator
MEQRRLVTMADIARQLGVSRQLVSAVLRDESGPSAEARERIIAAARQLGYRPHAGAQALRRARSIDIGVVFTPTHAAEPEIVESVYAALARRGLHAVLSALAGERTTGEAVDELLGHRCAAVVLVGSELSHLELSRLASSCPVPLVSVGTGRRSEAYDVVVSAGERGVAEAVRHLIGLGHSELLYLDVPAMRPARARLRGYRRAMRTAGLEPRVARCADTNDEWAGAGVAGLLLEQGDLPTGVLAANDRVAFGFLQVLRQSGVRVPEEVSVVGFDDLRLAQLPGVELTTLRQDPDAMAEAAVEAAARRLEDTGAAPVRILIPAPLVVRRTTGPARR